MGFYSPALRLDAATILSAQLMTRIQPKGLGRPASRMGLMQIHSAVFAALFLKRSPALSVLRITEQTPTSILMGGRESPERPERQGAFQSRFTRYPILLPLQPAGLPQCHWPKIFICWIEPTLNIANFQAPFLPCGASGGGLCHMVATTTRGRPPRSKLGPSFSMRNPPSRRSPATAGA